MANTRMKSKDAPAGNKPVSGRVEPDPVHTALYELFTGALEDIYWAEQQLTKSLPKLRDAATTEELKEAIEEHLGQTEKQVTRLEKVFELIGKEPEAKKCEAIAGLKKEAEEAIESTEEGTLTRDAALIMAAQKTEHYEIASYGTLVHFARTLGEMKAAELLEETLEEEKGADVLLTQIATNHINVASLGEIK